MCETAGTFSLAAQCVGQWRWWGFQVETSRIQKHKYLLHPSRRATVKARRAAFTGPKGGKTANELNCFAAHLCGVVHSGGRVKRDSEQHSVYRARPLICFE